MFFWKKRLIIYIRIRSDFVSVKIISKGRETSLYQDVPEVTFRYKKSSPNIEILGVGNNATVFYSLNQGSEVKRDNPFNHPRSLIKDFDLACETLKYFIVKAKQRDKFFTLFAPRIVMQPMDKLEGGLTSVEIRAFMDLGLQLGASEFYLYDGVQELSDEDILSIKKRKVKV